MANIRQRYSSEMGSGLPTGPHWVTGVKGCELFNLVYKVIKPFSILAIEGIQLRDVELVLRYGSAFWA